MIRLLGFDPRILAKRLFLRSVCWKPPIIAEITMWFLSSVIYNRLVWCTGYWESSVPIDQPSVTSQETRSWFCIPSIKIDISLLRLWFPRKTLAMFSSHTWQHFRNTQSSKRHELKDLRNYRITQLAAILRDGMWATKTEAALPTYCRYARLLPSIDFLGLQCVNVGMDCYMAEKWHNFYSWAPLCIYEMSRLLLFVIPYTG